ncbi:Cell wall assembly regulator [Mycoblastus sanguinarius]|nr:Cell wall assembly regulator [Mycoblastus sanguinarius]
MTSSDRHASHDSPYRTGQHMPLNQSRHAPLTSVATSAIESRADLSSPYGEDTLGQFTPGLHNGNIGPPGTPGAGPLQSPTLPYSPGMRSNLAMQRKMSNENNPFDNITPGEIQMQSFQEGLPPPPPVSHSWKKIDRWVEDNYEELWDQLSEGCTQNDVNELEHELDCSLPMEVRESLQVHDGQERGGRPTGIIFGCMLLDCEEIVQEWKNWKVVNEEYLTSPPTHHTQFPPKVFGGASSSSSNHLSQQVTNPLWRQELLDRQDSQPSRAIQKAYAHPGWIPLARDWGGNNLAVDLAPGPVGKWGQIIIFGRDYDCKYVVARSWAAFLAMVADDIGSEKVFVDEETQELKLKEFKAATVEPAYLDVLRWRMDQKYGRKGPRRRPSSGAGPSGHGSPYGSPERGRSPQRFPSNGSLNQSPRGAKGKPSPLAKVTEENAVPKIHTGGDATHDTFVQETAASEREGNLVELGSPTGPNEGYKQEPLGKVMEVDMSGVLNEATNGKDQKKPGATGLGVEGVDDMKSVEI